MKDKPADLWSAGFIIENKDSGDQLPEGGPFPEDYNEWIDLILIGIPHGKMIFLGFSANQIFIHTTSFFENIYIC